MFISGTEWGYSPGKSSSRHLDRVGITGGIFTPDLMITELWPQIRATVLLCKLAIAYLLGGYN